MSHVLTENDAFDSAVIVPDVLDQDYTSTIPAAFSAVSNRTRYLSNALTQPGAALDNTNTGIFDAGSYSAPSSTRQPILYNLAYQLISTSRFVRQYLWAGSQSNRFMGIPVHPYLEGDGGGNTQPPGTAVIGGAPWWNVSVSSNRVFWYQFSISPTTAPYILFPIRGLPPAGKILAFSLRIKGAGGHAALPATMPTLSLFRQTYGGTVSQVGTTVTDTSSNTTNYQAEHDLTLTDLTESIAENTNYYFKFTGETGTNKVAQLAVYECNIAIGS